MKTTAAFLVAATTLAHPVVAGGSGDNTWSSWTTSKAPEPSPAPEVGWTDWVTTTEYKEKTITVPGPTTTTTEYDTVTVTETPAPVTETLPPVTVTETLPPVTETETETLPPVTVTETETLVSVSGSVATVQNTVVNTVDNTVYNTVVNTEVSFITSVSVATQTVSSCPTTSVVLTGLVPCPSRITNADYSPPTPLPENYLWGCEPGYLCHPKKVDCNFESNPPAEGYVCAPEDCLPVVDYPIIDTTGLEDVNSTCAWLTPIDDYFNINPTLFGLTFDIFKTFGQEECSYTPPPPTPTPPPPAPPPPATTTTTPPPPPPPPTTTTTPPPPPPPPTTTTTPPPPPPPPSSSSSWSVWVAPAPVSSSWSVWSAAPVSSSWSAWGEPSKVTPAPVSSGWNNWNSNGGGNNNWGGHVTKRAALMPRQQEVIAGPACYAACNVACGIFQNVGKEDRLCDPDSDFNDAIANIDACNERHPADGTDLTTKVDLLAQALRYCATRSQSVATSTAEAVQAPTTTEAPAPATTPVETPSPETTAAPVETSSAEAPPPPPETTSAEPPAVATSSPEAPPAESSTSEATGGSESTAAASTGVATSLGATTTAAASQTLVSPIPTGLNAAGRVQAVNSIFTVLLSILAFFVRL